MKDVVRALAVLAVTVVVGGGTALALAPSTMTLLGVPLPLVVAAVALVVNLAAFVPAAALRSERFYDLTGSLTYLAVIAVVVVAAARAGVLDGPRAVVAALVVVWAVRLGAFLFRRVHQAGKDGRFDEMKRIPARFFVAWTLQALWVFLTALAATTFIARSGSASPSPAFLVGVALWLAGFVVEVVADAQKRAFAARAEHAGRFITTGLWAWSRHPNYFGEIVLWLGLFVAGVDRWQGAEWLTALSPAFVALLLTKVSGVPLLEARADRRWGDDPAYQAYKARTPVLVLRPPR